MVDPLRHLLTTDVADAVEVEIESLEDGGFSVEPISTAQSENINDYRGDETDIELMDDADSEAALALAALSSGTGVFGLMQRGDRSVKLAMDSEITEISSHASPAPPGLVATSRFEGVQSRTQPTFNTSPLVTSDQNRLTATRTSTAETITETSVYNAPGMVLVPDQGNSRMAESVPHSDATKDVDRGRPVAESGDQIAQAPPSPPFGAMTSSSTSALIAMSTTATTITSSSSFSEGNKPLQVQQVAGQRMRSLSHLLKARLSLASFKGEPAGERGDLHMNEHDRAKDHDIGIELERVENGHFRSRPESISHPEVQQKVVHPSIDAGPVEHS
ncbi:hypothetical protein BG011_002011 [Mortierella polycephala]|uniref:Uncharacterized protein n=1 Tax=Mortierella polycephala TaxID=41804 RepID=A0A9P6QHT5_9FUNG|nr:hypothetical protein BG011_002011 [Mortierella polycephala]